MLQYSRCFQDVASSLGVSGFLPLAERRQQTLLGIEYLREQGRLLRQKILTLEGRLLGQQALEKASNDRAEKCCFLEARLRVYDELTSALTDRILSYEFEKAAGVDEADQAHAILS